MDNIVQDYVRTAFAKGAGSTRVLYLHILRNSLIPMVTLLGFALPAILAGSLVTEQVFNYPGMGLLFYQEAAGLRLSDAAGHRADLRHRHRGGQPARGHRLRTARPESEVLMTIGQPLPDKDPAEEPRDVVADASSTEPTGGEVHGARRSALRRGLDVFAENRLALIGLAILLFFLGFCFLGPHVHPTDQVDSNLIDSNLRPGNGHVLGTDSNGYDELGRLDVRRPGVAHGRHRGRRARHGRRHPVRRRLGLRGRRRRRGDDADRRRGARDPDPLPAAGALLHLHARAGCDGAPDRLLQLARSRPPDPWRVIVTQGA